MKKAFLDKRKEWKTTFLNEENMFVEYACGKIKVVLADDALSIS